MSILSWRNLIHVRRALAARLSDVDVVTNNEFSRMTLAKVPGVDDAISVRNVTKPYGEERRATSTDRTMTTAGDSIRALDHFY